LTHSVFGSGAIERLERMPILKKAALDILASKHSHDPQMFAPDILLAFAFSNNPHGVVITSMFSKEHIGQNCALAEKPVSAEVSKCLRRMIKEGETRRD
jgi:aryl-alcohol dehydrogenase-like predicted oxidoreductase